MIAEENELISISIDLSELQEIFLECIKECIVKAIVPFKKARKQRNLMPKLNEIKQTQLLVEQISFQLKPFPGIAVNSNYSDIYFGTKGISDFYFYYLEEGKTHFPLFVIESKRLPAPEKTREKEYVLGSNNNGGIERYKKEIHGKNSDECGMIGFIEKYTALYWLDKINGWIIDLAKNNTAWKNDEQLKLQLNTNEYCYLVSNAYRESARNNVLLSHWWIICE